MEFVVVAVIAVAVLALGFGLGMLVAPRIGRWAESDDEEPRDDRSG
jgi:hypothetical protein